VLVVLPVGGLAGIAAIAQQQQQAQQDTTQQGATDPVAEAARKAREQKKAEPKPKKVYTNEDFGGGTPAPAAAATTANGEPKEGAAADDKDKAPADGANKNGEEAWRKRFKDARDKLAQAEQELDILQREAQKAQVQYYSDPQKALAEQYSRKDITDNDTKIDAKKQEIAQMKQHISDLEDELRKSGGDPGWAR
jgi:glucose/arabinose dehydrogenase